jgi:hypothetical protein
MGDNQLTRGVLALASVICVALALGLPHVVYGAAGWSPVQQANATVTGTPLGAYVIVIEEANVRTGPGTNYDQIGVLIAGQELAALGRSPGGDWIQIAYPGVPDGVAWVYSFLVRLESQQVLPIVEPPATSTPRATPTIDPTLAAQFNLGEAPATRLPTFTPAEPVIQPTFQVSESFEQRGIPPILSILGLLVVGLLGTFISFLRGN